MAERTETHDADDLAALARLNIHFGKICGAIDESDWSRPTPCTDWDLHQLVDHVIGGNRFTARILDGDTAAEAMDFAVGSFAAEPTTAASAIASLDELRAPFGAAGALGRSFPHVVGEISGRQVLRLRLHDVIVHTWDIAQAIELDVALPSELVDWGLGELARADSFLASTPDADPPPSSLADGQSPEAAYLAGFDRAPIHPDRHGTPSKGPERR